MDRNPKGDLLKDKGLDIGPMGSGEADQLSQLNEIRRGFHRGVALDSADKGRPGFQADFLKEKGILELKPTGQGEADPFRSIVSDTPDVGGIMLDEMEKMSPGFREHFLKEQGITPISSGAEPRSDKSP